MFDRTLVPLTALMAILWMVCHREGTRRSAKGRRPFADSAIAASQDQRCVRARHFLECRRMKHAVRNMEKYKPAVTKVVLLFLAGGVWICVGVMLVSLAVSWLLATADGNGYVFAGSGVALALVVHHFGFLRIVDKNLKRILPADKKRCIFSFMPWKSYLIIPVMITMGIILRHSPVPKEYLAILYLGIGLALILSSVRYVRVFLREIREHTLA